MTRDNNKEKKKKKSKFFKIYFGFLIAGVVLLIIAVIVLNALLRDFESVQPKYLAEKVFSDWFTGGTGELVNVIKEHSTEFETDEQLSHYIDEATSGGALSYSEISNGLNSGRKYAVKAGDKRIFTFTLNEAEERSAFGFKQYVPGDIEAPSGKLSVKCAVPDGYSLYLNGVKVGDSFRTGEKRKIDLFEYLPETVNAPEQNVYQIDGLFCTPVVTSDNGSGIAAEVKYNEKEGVYEAGLVYDAELEDQFSDYVIEAAEAYAAYMQNDASFRTVAQYLDSDSELYELTRTTQTGFVWDHEGYEFSEESASEFIRYDENTFSCRVKLTHTLHKRGNDDYVEYLDVTFFLHRAGEDWLIFDRFNTN